MNGKRQKVIERYFWRLKKNEKRKSSKTKWRRKNVSYD